MFPVMTTEIACNEVCVRQCFSVNNQTETNHQSNRLARRTAIDGLTVAILGTLEESHV